LIGPIQEALALCKEPKQEKTAVMALISQNNIDFHILLAPATKNILLEIVMESIMKFIHLFFGLMQPSYGFCCWHIAQHRTILNAISENEISAAKERLKEHNDAVKKHFSDLLKNMQAIAV
jgi:DNA-binding FadR family transcriptional regulator